jgi:ABC-type Zn uptake system ZnuABC Zn-binding protein ZnuA
VSVYSSFFNIIAKIAFSALIPDKKQMAWLLLTVLYLPQLTPEVKNKESPASPIWQKSQEFWEDYNRAKRAAVAVGRHLASEDPSFKTEFEKLEDIFTNICERLSQMNSKTSAVKKMSFYTSLCQSV